jgi:heme exporter protein CcmD
MMETLVGKYAAYIIPAYGITTAVIGYLIVSSLLHARRWRRRAEDEAKR